MANADIREELEKLREQVAALAGKHKQQHSGPNAEREEGPETEAEVGETEHAVRKQLEEIIKMFQEEIHDMPAMPTLAVFMLGVIVGRYLR